MKKELQQPAGKCIYCGTAPAASYDHIPPKNLFSQPRPSLITVPCCLKCNGDASKDDEYFRLMLTMQNDAYNHPDAKKVWTGPVLRSLKNPNKKGLTVGLVNKITKLPIYTKAGIYLGDHPGVKGDLGRLLKVTSRIIKGLYYHEFNKRLPDNYEVATFIIDRFQGEKYFDDANTLQHFALLLSAKKVTIGSDVFSYRRLVTQDDEYTSLWLLSFFRGVMFLGITLNKENKFVPLA